MSAIVQAPSASESVQASPLTIRSIYLPAPSGVVSNSKDIGDLRLVSRFRSSHHCAASSFANFGIDKDTSNLLILVWLWFRSPHDRLAAAMMRSSEPPHTRSHDPIMLNPIMISR